MSCSATTIARSPACSGRRNGDPVTAIRIARAIVKEAGRLKVAPSLLTGVLLTENPQLETERSAARARSV